MFRCPVRARASWSGWVLSKSAMRVPLRRQDARLGRWLENQAAEIIARQPKDGDIREQVLGILTTQATVGDLRLDTVARRLTITPRTLQRRLAQTGTSFEILCDQARRAAAETYLTNTTLSISEVTYLLGYSEPAAFHRACRRWLAASPLSPFGNSIRNLAIPGPKHRGNRSCGHTTVLRRFVGNPEVIPKRASSPTSRPELSRWCDGRYRVSWSQQFWRWVI